MSSTPFPTPTPPGLPPGALVYTAQQVCAALQIDQVTLWRLEKRGRLRRVLGLRHRRYACEEVERFRLAA